LAPHVSEPPKNTTESGVPASARFENSAKLADLSSPKAIFPTKESIDATVTINIRESTTQNPAEIGVSEYCYAISSA
jgi:hypothetical protein